MTKAEFSAVLAYIARAIGKPIGDTPEESAHRAAVYFDLLGDLPLDVLQIAAKRVCLEHRWATFPTPAELREAASLTQRGHVVEVSPAEAWTIARRIAAAYEPEFSGPYWSCGREWPSQWAYLTHRVPPIVVAAINAVGVLSLACGRDPLGVVRAQFGKVFEQLAARERRQALLPGSVRQAIESRVPALPDVEQSLRAIGRMDEIRR